MGAIRALQEYEIVVSKFPSLKVDENSKKGTTPRLSRRGKRTGKRRVEAIHITERRGTTFKKTAVNL